MMIIKRTSPRSDAAMLWGLSRPFWALWSAQLVNRIASFAQPFLVLYLTQDHAISAGTAGSVAGAVGVGLIAANLVGGWMSDRIGRKGTMITGQVLTAGALLWLAYAQGLWQLWLSAVLVGIGGDLVRPAMSACVSDIVPEERRVRAYGLLFWAVNLGFSFAAITGGFLTRWGYSTLFLVNATCSVIAGLLILREVPETKPETRSSDAPFIKTLLRDRGTLVLTAVETLYSIVYFQAYSTLPLVMAEQKISAAMYGTVLAVNGVVICVLQPFAVKVIEKRDPLHVLVIGMLVVGIGFACTALAQAVWQHMLMVAIWTIGEVAVAGVIAAMFADRAPAAHRGRYLSLVGIAMAVGAAVGPPLGAAAFEFAGATPLWLGCGASCLFGAALLRFLRNAPTV